jgi:hypothetical protein
MPRPEPQFLSEEGSAIIMYTIKLVFSFLHECIQPFFAMHYCARCHFLTSRQMHMLLHPVMQFPLITSQHMPLHLYMPLCLITLSHAHAPCTPCICHVQDLGDLGPAFSTTYADGFPISESTVTAIKDARWHAAYGFGLQPGDWLVLDNRRVQHGRTPYSGGHRQLLVLMA